MQSADCLDEGGSYSQKGSGVTKDFIRTRHEQFIGGALEQLYSRIRGKPQTQWESITVFFFKSFIRQPFESKSLLMNSF